MRGASLENERFDVLVLGTGPVEALVASELSDQGHKVLHIDRSPQYGGYHAALSVSGFLKWATSTRDRRQIPRVDIHAPASPVASSEPLAIEVVEHAFANLALNDRSYAIELAPRLVRCRGKAIDVLVDAGVGDYMQFCAVDGNYIAGRDQPLRRVPESKEDVFAATWLSLIEKRKLMRLLTLLSDASELPADSDKPFAEWLADRPIALSGRLLDAIVYAVARQGRRPLSAREGCEAVRRYVAAMGRYGRMAYLCAMYGGASEAAQSFCRLCAVAGGTYILDEKPSVAPSGDGVGFDVALRNGSAHVRSIVMDPTYAPDAEQSADPATTVARALCIIDGAPLDASCSAAALLSFVADGRAVSLLYMTDAAKTVPQGQAIVYAWIEGTLADSKSLLSEALEAVIGASDSVACQPLLTAFYEVCELVPPSGPGIVYTDGPTADIDFDSIIDSAQRALFATNITLI
ncbi:hypothetical protein LPJ59_002901 [Coemansia sp. RSA 2399]|nr:hypothetical protein LPJ59_002901 [Coemansia sp. RSA 2399]KAJ1904308.1 hypothetical protein LPJ81_002570 [Coemansia sp. IMI 209127]